MHRKKPKMCNSDIPRLPWNDMGIEYEKIRFDRIKHRKIKATYFTFVATVGIILILCFALLISSLGDYNGFLGDVSEILIKNAFLNLSLPWKDKDLPTDVITDITEGILIPSKHPTNAPTDKEDDDNDSNDEKTDIKDLYDFDYTAVPEGEIPIIPMDLSLASYGAAYIHNSTGLLPDTKKLLETRLGYVSSPEYLTASSAPTVLIIHTHGTEAYSDNNAISYKDDGEELARSIDTEKNVIAIGAALNASLRKKGIKSVHCEIMHDKDGYLSSYSRAEETIRSYLERYPTIKLVIDLHRDSIVRSSGELVRPVTLIDGEPAAQVMCVVGSDWGGEANPRWEANLALALQFREYLNEKHTNLCRPVYLKSSTYNQEFAPYSLLLEIGSSGNSLEEALRSVDAVSDAIMIFFSKK